ncbi:ArsR/SmtB family transcription factor [Tropicimonas sp. S265A]|uniref:ArsR/SmtB family transcription factor n=1 Tax=Tropicimonas sp. S265A TaxID=3415134 RepID=UPI003C7E2E68
MEESQVLGMLSALSEQTRLRMLRFLVTRGPDGAPAGEVAAAVGASSSRSSFHLSALERAGVLTSEKRSRQVIYRANFPALGAFLAFLLEDCCAGHPEVRECCTGAARS